MEKQITETFEVLRPYVKICHDLAVENGWWEDAPTGGQERLEWLAMKIDLIACEGAEFVEAMRAGRRAYYNTYMMEKERKGERKAFKEWIKDTAEDELADIAIRILDYMGGTARRLMLGLIPDHDKIKGITPLEIVRKVRFLCLGAALDEWIFPGDLLGLVIIAAIKMDVDLIWHIDKKLEYNKGRGQRHGKKF